MLRSRSPYFTATAVGLYVFLRLGDLRGPLLLVAAAYAAWKLHRTALNNLPRDYTPDRVPEWLLEFQADADNVECRRGFHSTKLKTA